MDYLRYASECRIDSIGYGCLFAIWQNRFDFGLSLVQRLHTPILLAGSIVVLAFTFGKSVHLSGITHEILVYDGQGIGLLMIFAALYAGEGSPAVRLLEIQPLRFIGRVSYGVYIWHYVFVSMAFSAIGYMEPADAPLQSRLLWVFLVIGLSTLAGYLSFRFMLTPFNRIRRKFGAHVVDKNRSIEPPMEGYLPTADAQKHPGKTG